MAYGTVKVDNITFDNGGSDQNVTVSGLYRATTSGVTVTGTISGAVLVGTTTVSGATVTGTIVQGTTVQGVSGTFTSLTGITTSGTTANFVSGVFTTQVSGTTITGTTSNFTSGNFATLSGATATFTSGVIASGTATNPSLSILGDPNTGAYSPGADQLGIVTNGVERIKFGSTEVVINDGGTDYDLRIEGDTNSNLFYVDASTDRVGIGTSSPTTILDVNGDVKAAGIFSSAAGTATAPSIAFTGDLNTGIYSPGADQLALSTAGNGRLFIDGTGYVGIGTVPSVGLGLDIRGLTRILSVGGASGLEIGTGTATNQFASLDLVGDATYVDYGLRILRGNSGANAESNIAHKGTGALSFITEEAAPIVLATSNAERLRITSAGNVGIGTTSPSFNLVSANSTTDGGWLYSSGSVSTLGLGGYSLAGDGAFQLKYERSTGVITFNGGSRDTPVERLRIGNTGNVGIGTSSPSQALDVGSGNITLGSTLFSGAGVSTGDVSFEHGGNRTGSGNVYIDLHAVSGGDFQSRILRDGGANGAFSIVNNGTGNFVIAQTNAAAITFGTDNSERARIDSSGRLLVGTSVERSNFFNTTITANILLENDNAVLGVVRNGNNAFSSYLVLAKSRSGSNTIVQADDQLGSVNFQGNDGTEFVEAAQISAFVDGTPGANDMPGRLVFSVTADGSASPTEALRISSNRAITVSDGGNVVLGTTTGTKIGTATTQKIGFYNATPVVQPTAVADATDAATVITQLNALLTRMRNLGLIAT